MSSAVTKSGSVGKSGLCRRIIPCLDVANGRTVKGIKFTEIRDAGDPLELALIYEEQGADELVFLDITASHEERKTTVDLVKRVAAKLSIPFTVGGGISTLQDALALLQAGADKVSVNTSAVLRPELISEIAGTCGSQCCVLAIDARKAVDETRNSASGNDGDAGRDVGTGIRDGHTGIRDGHASIRDEQNNAVNGDIKWDVLTHGGRKNTGLSALEWGKKAVALGAGEILLTSWDQDGTRSGFDLELCRAFSDALSVPIIASGGARDADSFIDVFIQGKADAALAATIFHDSIWSIDKLKELIHQAGIRVRLC
jgi:cyclase